MTPPFDRTVCACRFCRDCCRAPACLGPGDVERIAEYRQETIDDTLSRLEPGRGSLVMSADGCVRRVPTMVPKRDASGWCVFRGAQGECTIHPVSPMGCAYFDVHMGDRDSMRRAVWVCNAQETDPVYRATVDALRLRDSPNKTAAKD